jgi:hypothetical protein
LLIKRVTARHRPALLTARARRQSNRALDRCFRTSLGVCVRLDSVYRYHVRKARRRRAKKTTTPSRTFLDSSAKNCAPLARSMLSSSAGPRRISGQ